MICCELWSEEDYHLMNKHQPETFISAERSLQVQPPNIMVQQEVYVPPRITTQVQLSPVTEEVPYYYLPVAPKLQAIPRTPPCSIPGYYTSKSRREEPGVGEMLLGCGILLALAVAVLTVLFFLIT